MGNLRSASAVRRIASAAALALWLPLSAAAPAAAAPPVAAEETGVARATDHVIVISIDGLRPDAIDKFGATTLQRLIREGAYSLQAQTILPSKTLPSHTSMLTGVEPAVHGITWNGDRTMFTGKVRVPTVFLVARQAGLKTAAFFSKSKFHHLELPGSLNHVESPFGWWGTWTAEQTLAQVEDDLGKSDWNMVFVHFGEPDYAGHAHGWMTPAYADAVRKADAAVAKVIEEADAAFGEGNYTLIVTADHGGDEHGHGLDDAEHRTIPWIAWGKGVDAGEMIADGVYTTDTAATMLWLLGVPVPADWNGKPVRSAFDATAAPALASATNE